MSRQQEIIQVLKQHPEGISISNLAKILGANLSNISVACSALRKHRMITAENDLHDRRVTVVKYNG